MKTILTMFEGDCKIFVTPQAKIEVVRCKPDELCALFTCSKGCRAYQLIKEALV